MNHDSGGLTRVEESGEPGVMSRTGIIGKLMAVGAAAMTVVACYAQATVGGPTEECRNVEVRRPRDVEVCRSRCTENGCREHCSEQERWAREHRCWVE